MRPNLLLRVGARVNCPVPGGGRCDGEVQFVGTTEFAEGDWAGVALDSPQGLNDGCVDLVRYFDPVAPFHGLFVRPSELRPALAPAPAKAPPAWKPPPLPCCICGVLPNPPATIVSVCDGMYHHPCPWRSRLCEECYEWDLFCPHCNNDDVPPTAPCLRSTGTGGERF